MKNVLISKAKRADVNTIVKIHRRCVQQTNAKIYSLNIVEDWLKQINKDSVLSQFQNSAWLIFKKDGKIIGFAQYSIEDGALYQIQIDPTQQGKGYGKALYSYIESKFIKYGKSKISLNATLNAQRFYSSLGFKSLDHTFFGSIEMVQMEKRFGS